MSLSEYEQVLLAAYQIPNGLTLFKVDPKTGLTTSPFTTPRYLELMHQDPELLRVNGVAAVTQHVHDCDRTLCDMYVIESSQRELVGEHIDCLIAYRVKQEGSEEYTWMRQWTISGILHDGYLTWSCMVEPFQEGVDRMVETLNEERSERMLAAFSNKVFHCALLTDERMRIISDSPDQRKRIYGDSSRSLKGAPLESLIPLDQHKLALRTYFRERRENLSKVTPPFRLRMNLRRQMLSEVDIQVFPLADGHNVVGIDVVGQKNQPKTRPQPKAQSSPVLEPPKPRITTSGPDIIGEVYRNVISDLQYSMQCCERINGWFVPVRKPKDPEVITDYLLMAIPEHVQADFAEAAQKADYKSCAQILSFTVYGNANILSQSRWKQLTDNTDLIHVVYRFFVNLVPHLADQPAKQFSLLSTLHDAQKALLFRRLDRESYTSTVYRFAIVIMSAAARNPQYYSTDISMNWLRPVFMDALKIPISDADSGHKLLVVYWLCILWAGAMHSMQGERRTQESIAVLRKLETELDNYLRQFPCSLIANELMGLCLSNLKTSVGKKERKRLEKKIETLPRMRQSVAFSHSNDHL